MRGLGVTCFCSRVCLHLACLLFAFAPALAVGAVDVDFSASRECASGLALDDAISNETLFAEVSRWSHGKARDWTYESLTADTKTTQAQSMGLTTEEAAAAACVLVHYGSLLEIPEPLKGLLELLRIGVVVEIKIKKHVCKSGRVVAEDVEVEAPLVEETRIRTRTEASDTTLSSKSNMHLRVPWWATVLEAQVGDAMRRSVSEKLDAVMDTLCVAQQGALQQRRLLQAGPRGSFMRRALHRPNDFHKEHPLMPPRPRTPKVEENATEAPPNVTAAMIANATEGLIALVVEEMLVLPIAAVKAAEAAMETEQADKTGAPQPQKPDSVEMTKADKAPHHARPKQELRGLAALHARREKHAKTLFTLRRRELTDKTLQNARLY
jgi:hypothetical protein